MEFSEEYIETFIPSRNDLLQKMEQFAKENHIPIMKLDAIEVLLQLLRIQKPKRILEIGTAIGYSAIRMAEALPNAQIITIERDTKRLELAKNFIEQSNTASRITLIEGDALEVEVSPTTVDAVFIDAAKGQNKRFFEKYSPLVPQGGIIYIDNMYMHGLSNLELTEVPKRKRTMIRNLKEFTSWISNHPDYVTTFVPVGDGLLICLKR